MMAFELSDNFPRLVAFLNCFDVQTHEDAEHMSREGVNRQWRVKDDIGMYERVRQPPKSHMCRSM